ncbi:MAG TPA: hypothetical protein EYP56_20905 [Planctomycetaceae bacterium]|nr:hypothetical protein [Planctomycetaceae bacterium]
MQTQRPQIGDIVFGGEHGIRYVWLALGVSHGSSFPMDEVNWTSTASVVYHRAFPYGTNGGGSVPWYDEAPAGGARPGGS